MENFTFCTPTRYVFGRGVEAQTGGLTAAMGAGRVLIVYGQGSVVRSGLLDRVKDSLTKAGVEFEELGGVKPNPGDTLVREGIAKVAATGCDGILAVGGGSAIDTAKAIAAGACYDGDVWDFFCGKAVVEKALPIGVVLTIPAAGSEGSGNSVITRESDRRKISIRTDFWLRPKFAVMNPELTFTLPQDQTVAGIADIDGSHHGALFHHYRGGGDHRPCRRRVLRAIITEAPKVVAAPADYESRANIMWAGTLAHNGVCGCGRREDWASHGLEHELSALYGVTHGAGLAVIFPAWMEYVSSRRPAKIAQFARRVFDVAEDNDLRAALEGVRRLRGFFRGIGLPVTLGELGIASPDYDTLVTRFHENKGTPAGTYLPLYPEDTRAIYELAAKG